MTKKPAPSKLTLPKGLSLTRPEQPRWIASPALRRLGFANACGLKHPDGRFMSLFEAIEAATRINAMVEDVKSGLAARGPYAHLAPGCLISAAGVNERSIGFLLDAYHGVPDVARKGHWLIEPSDAFMELSPESREDRTGRLRRLCEALCGFPDGPPERMTLPPALKAERQAAYVAGMQILRDTDISDLCLEDDKGRTPLERAYKFLSEMKNARTDKPQVSNANSIMRITSAWLSWVLKAQKRRAYLPFNPMTLITRKADTGRVVVWSPDEEARFDTHATASGWASVALIRRWAIELSWSQKDILALTVGQVKETQRATRVQGTRSKTGNMTHTTLTSDGLKLWEDTKAYLRTVWGANVTLTSDMPLFVADAIPGRLDRGAAGKPWNSSYFQHTFINLKAECVPPIDKTFQDLRDTAITRMLEAGMNPAQIQSRSQHSLAQIMNIIDKHYGLTTLDISDEAAAMLDAHRNKKKTSHK